MELGNMDNTPDIQTNNLSKNDEGTERDPLMAEESLKTRESFHQTGRESDISVMDTEPSSPDVLKENSDSEEKEGTLWFRLKKDKVFRKKYLLTSAHIMSFISLGWVEGQLGPTFPDLLFITDATLDEGSVFFTTATLGYLLGSIIMGYLFDKENMDKSLLMFITMIGYSVTIAIVPWCELYEIMVVIHIFKGAFGGSLETCGNAGLLHIWGREGDPYFNALHFSFAFGGILSPLAAAPYVMSRDHTTEPHAMNGTRDFSNTSSGNDWDLYNITHLNSTEKSLESPSSMIYIPYTTSAGICLLTSLPFLVFLCVSLQKTLEKEKPNEEIESKRKTQKRLRVMGFITMTAYMAVYCAVQDIFIGFLTTFVISGLNWTNAEGSYLTSGYCALYASGRFLGIFLVQCLSSAKLIFICNFMFIISLLGFLMMSFHDVIIGIWISTLMTGFSSSVIFPVVFMWTEQKFLRVTGKIASVFIVASSIGVMVNSPILGALMEIFTPMWFCYLLLAEAVFVFMLFFVGLFIARRIDSEKTIEPDLELEVFNDKEDV